MVGNKYELTPEDKAILTEIKARLEPYRDEISAKWVQLMEKTKLLGVNLTGIVTQQDLRRGLEYAFRVMDLQIVRREEMGAKVLTPEEKEGAS